MINFSDIEEVLAFSINVERQESQFYHDCAEKTSAEGMREVFLGFANEEISHMERLKSLKDELSFPARKHKFRKFIINIPEENSDVTEGKFSNFNYQSVLKYAIRNETAAFNLYCQLADYAEDENIKGLLQELAREELAHKVKFEDEYHKNFE